MSVTDCLVTYLFAALLLTITPGLDTALILRTSTLNGAKKAFQVALGIDTGCFIWGIVVAFGLGGLLIASEMAYNLLKWCGVAYLLWLGGQLLFKPRQLFELANGQASTSSWFLRGMLTNALKPKMGIFYLSFLPQFIPTGHSPIVWTFLLVFIHVLIGTIWSLILIFATRYVSGFIKNSIFIKWIDRLSGGLFIIFAIKLILSTH